MAMHVCKNISEDFSVINKLLSNKYPISTLYLSKWLIYTILTHMYFFGQNYGLKLSGCPIYQNDWHMIET